MLQHEFESLTGLKINESQYEVINGMYSCSDNQTKHDFCKMFMAMELMSHVDNVVNLKVVKMGLSRNCRKAEERAGELEKQVLYWTNKYQDIDALLRETGKTLRNMGTKLTAEQLIADDLADSETQRASATEKRAELNIRAQKYGADKDAGHTNGRWYARSEAYQPYGTRVDEDGFGHYEEEGGEG